MPAYLIMGPSGSGKTTVGAVLARQHFRVVDLDMVPGLIDWVDPASQAVIMGAPAHHYSREWRETHERDWNASKMHELLGEAEHETVFYCGGAANNRQFFAAFRLCFGLYTDGQTVVRRLQKRNPTRWSNQAPELRQLLEWNYRFPDFCRETGIILVDSSPRPEVVANHILAYI